MIILDEKRKLLAELAARVPSKNSVSGQMKAVTITNDPSGVFAEAFGGDLGMRILLDNSPDTDIPTITVEGARLSAALQKMRGDVTFSLRDTTLSIRDETGSVCLPTHEKHVALPDTGATYGTAKINGDLLNEITSVIKKFAAKNDAMHSLSGVYWNPINGDLVATDTHTLAVARISLDAPGVKSDAISVIPVAAFDAVGAFMAGAIDVTFADNMVQFSMPDMIIQHSLIAGKFPNYEEIVSKLELPHWVCVDAKSFRDAVEFIRAARLPGEESSAIRLRTKNMVLHITEQNGRVKPEHAATISIPLDGSEGDELDISVNSEYMKRCILGGGKIGIDFRDKNSPLRVKASSGEDLDRVQCIVSPIYPKN